MQLQSETGFKVSTTSFGNILKVALELKPAEILYLSLGAFLEAIAYIQAKIEVRKGAIPFAWEPIRSTKT
jgi:hypothetical protein